jgi:hypothetical protein
VSNIISNLSRRTHRRMAQTVFLSYGSLPLVGALCDDVRVELEALPGVNKRSCQ